jgi:U-box domain
MEQVMSVHTVGSQNAFFEVNGTEANEAEEKEAKKNALLGVNKTGETKFDFYTSRYWEEVKQDSTSFLKWTGIGAGIGGGLGGTSGFFIGLKIGMLLGPGSALTAGVGAGVGCASGLVSGAVAGAGLAAALKLYSYRVWVPPYLEDDVKEFFFREVDENPQLAHIRCAIDLQIAEDPVVTAHGKQVYDRANLVEWINTGKHVDPLTKQEINLESLKNGTPLVNKTLIYVAQKEAERLKEEGEANKAKPFEEYATFLTKKLIAEYIEKEQALTIQYKSGALPPSDFLKLKNELTKTYSLDDDLVNNM